MAPRKILMYLEKTARDMVLHTGYGDPECLRNFAVRVAAKDLQFERRLTFRRQMFDGL
jgi:hypothetical protein